jgi:hypothetical protein
VQAVVQVLSTHVLLVKVWVSVPQTVLFVQAFAMRQRLSSIMMQVCSLTHTGSGGGGGGGGQPPMRGSDLSGSLHQLVKSLDSVRFGFGKLENAPVDLLCASTALRENSSRMERILKSIMTLLFSCAMFKCSRLSKREGEWTVKEEITSC